MTFWCKHEAAVERDTTVGDARTRVAQALLGFISCGGQGRADAQFHCRAANSARPIDAALKCALFSRAMPLCSFVRLL